MITEPEPIENPSVTLEEKIFYTLFVTVAFFAVMTALFGYWVIDDPVVRGCGYASFFASVISFVICFIKNIVRVELTPEGKKPGIHLQLAAVAFFFLIVSIWVFQFSAWVFGYDHLTYKMAGFIFWSSLGLHFFNLIGRGVRHVVENI